MSFNVVFPIACATCRPEAGSLMAQAQDLAVLVMLGFLVAGMGCVGLIIMNFARKQSSVSTSQPS